jgi:hypothetical protein
MIGDRLVTVSRTRDAPTTGGTIPSTALALVVLGGGRAAVDAAVFNLR